jgi:hypothetical protein
MVTARIKRKLPVVVEQAAPEAVVKHSMPTGKSHVSYSEIMDWKECSYRHKLKHVQKISLDGGSIHTAFGKAVHDAAEAYITTRNLPSAKETLKEFRRQLKDLDSEAQTKAIKLLPEFIDNLPDMIGQIPDWLDSTFPGWECVDAEHLLMEGIKKQNDVKFKGFIDAVLKIEKKPTKKLLKEYANKGEVPPKAYEYVICDWKGQRLDAPILTPSGWTTMGELKIGTDVVGSNGEAIKVTGIFPLGQREVYRVHLRDGSHVDTTDDHLWKVYTPKSSGSKDVDGRFSKVLTTKELMSEKRYLYLPSLTSPAQFDRSPTPYKIDPYLLGVLLGDGSFRGGIKLSSADQQVINEVCSLLPKKVKLRKVGNSKYDYGLTISHKGYNPKIEHNRNPILNEIKSMGLFGLLSHDKFIPQDYLFGDPEQRLGILQGLLDTDGWSQKGVAKFSTTSKQLAGGVKHLTCSLGGVAFMSERPLRHGANHIEHIVTVRLPKKMQPFRLKRKLEKWNPSLVCGTYRKISKIEKLSEKAPMQCIKVSAANSLYVTNDFVITHNTCSWGWKTDQKRSFEKQMQLIFYKHFFCSKMNIPLKDVKCAFILIKRVPKKERKPGDRIELVPVSVGPVAVDKALKVLHNMINQVKLGFTSKNRRYCKPFCPYMGTKHCT